MISARAFQRVFTCKIGVDTAENEPLEVWGKFNSLFICLLGLNVVLDREFPNPTCRPHVPWRTTAQVPILNARRVQEAGQMSLHAGGVEPAVLARPKSYIQQVLSRRMNK